MLEKIINFIKYNNATVIILALVLILGGGAFAAGPDAIGQAQTTVEGIDNSLLIQADLTNFNMDFKIEKTEQDELYYYATYSYLDLVVLDNAWQYQLNSKTQKISKKIKEDLGAYLAKFLAKHHEARVRELKLAQSEAQSQGEQKRVEVTEYSGLIGKTLDLAAKVFPGYEAIKKVELPAPEFNLATTTPTESAPTKPDNLTQIYNDYVAAHPEVFTTPVDTSASSTDSSVPEEPVAPSDPVTPEPTDVQIIDLPAPEPAPVPTDVTPAPAEPAPVPEPASTPAPAESAPVSTEQ